MQPLSLTTNFRNYLLLFAGCVLFHVLGTWKLPLIDRDEPRFAEASREMRERRDWIVPYFNGQYRFDKPPLTYWAQVASYQLFGENDFAARFPSAVAAGLTALVILRWGSRLDRPAIGWTAAIIFTLSLQTFVHAKAAVADMWLALFMTTAWWAGWELLFGEPKSKRRTPNAERRILDPIQRFNDSTIPRACWWIFYVSLALAFLAKGPIGLIPLIAMIWMLARTDSAHRWLSLAGGLVVTFAIIGLWAVPALLATHGDFFRIGIGRHVVGRSIGAMEGHGAKSIGLYLILLPFYFVTVFVSFFPWSFKLPWLAGTMRKHRDQADLYLVTGILCVFGIFTVVATKLPHYTLPAFPLLALLLARHWPSVDSFKTFTIVAVTAASAYIVIALALPPVVARYFPSYVLFQSSRDYLRPDMEIASIGFNEPSIVWYFRSHVKTFVVPLKKNNVREFMSKPGPRLVILTDKDEDAIVTQGEWKHFEATGFNIPKGKTVNLKLLLKPE